MIKVYSSQFNYKYGEQIHFPYSIARLVSYIKHNTDFGSNFEFKKTFIFRDNVESYIESCIDCDILLCSCYVWNWEITKYAAEKIKEKNPNCLIIFGGPQIPNHSEGFFKNHPYVDIIVHGEGELVLSNIFKEFLNEKNFLQIKGIETKDFKNEPEDRIRELDKLASPYLTNVVWDLVEKIDDVNFLASWETNRGCPYQCTFCDWGSLTNTKMTNWSQDVLFKEIEWFADNKIPYVDCCDANFGIYQERDFKLAEKFKDEALKKGFPERVRPAWAKFSSEKIIPIAKQLQDGGLLRAVTLALQSLDETTLEIVKRDNIKFDEFSALTETFRENGIPTYTEMIMGMPGETLESWKKGLETLARDTKIGSIYIYNCGIFPNAPMNEPVYRKLHDIKTQRSPIYLAHSSIHNRGMPEYEDIAVSTKSFSVDTLKEIYLYSWLIQTFHSLGIFEYVSKFYKINNDLSYMEFYETFLEYCRTNQTMFSEEYEKVVKYIDDGYSGKGWNYHDPQFGDIYWPIEEVTWLRFSLNKDELEKETKSFLIFLAKKFDYDISDELLSDLVKFQIFLITTRTNDEIKSEIFSHDWKDYFTNEQNLKKITKSYYYKNLVLEDDSIEWGFKAIWYGRGSKNYKCHHEKLSEQNQSPNVRENPPEPVLKC